MALLLYPTQFGSIDDVVGDLFHEWAVVLHVSVGVVEVVHHGADETERVNLVRDDEFDDDFLHYFPFVVVAFSIAMRLAHATPPLPSQLYLLPHRFCSSCLYATLSACPSMHPSALQLRRRGVLHSSCKAQRTPQRESPQPS